MSRAAININKKQFEQIMISCGAFFTSDQVADCLDVGRMTLYRWIKKEYPKENFDTLRARFSSKAKYQLNAYRWKAMASGNGRLIERSMEEAGLWPKRDAQKLDMTVTEKNQVIAYIPANGRDHADNGD